MSTHRDQANIATGEERDVIGKRGARWIVEAGSNASTCLLFNLLVVCHGQLAKSGSKISALPEHRTAHAFHLSTQPCDSVKVAWLLVGVPWSAKMESHVFRPLAGGGVWIPCSGESPHEWLSMPRIHWSRHVSNAIATRRRRARVIPPLVVRDLGRVASFVS